MRSLKLRTMTITAVVTGFMIAVSGTFILTSVGDDLYSSPRDQVLQDSARATLAAQGQVDASSASDRGALLALSASVRRTVQDTSSSQLIYVRRQPGQDFFPDAPDDFYTSPQLVDAVSTELSRAVRSGEAPQYWQPVTLTDDTGASAPGILVASSITFPAGAGEYDLFIGYSLADTERTLAFITRTLGITALFLMLLIGGLVWAISNIVFRPIRAAADASRRLDQLLVVGEDLIDLESLRDCEMDGVVAAQRGEAGGGDEVLLRDLHELDVIQCAAHLLVVEMLGPATGGAVQLCEEQPGRSEDRHAC